MKLQEILDKGIKRFRRTKWRKECHLHEGMSDFDIGMNLNFHDFYADDWEEYRKIITKEAWIIFYKEEDGSYSADGLICDTEEQAKLHCNKPHIKYSKITWKEEE